jgi:XTP/dITP diphosphohydrolase
MKLIIASNNSHKIREIKTILSGKFEQILSLRDAEIDHETVEDGKTFMENALKKAREISEISGCAALADDSGICAHALGDEPGIYSARYVGVDGAHGADAANNALLVKNLADKEDKGAHYTCAIALVYPDGREVTAEGYMYGKIIDTPRGERGFGYDPIFVMDGETRTVAQMSDEEKNAVSHRAKALESLLAKI